MDIELLVALCVLWFSSTFALVVFLTMWFKNEAEAFHPHSVEIDARHSLFSVVSSETVCKYDFAVKSISAFVAPRGSSSSKLFNVFIIILAVAGFLGSFRWYAVGDAGLLESTLAQIGFAALILVAACEMDVVPSKFFEDKLLVTSWLLEKIGADKRLPFKLDPECMAFRDFIRNSEGIRHMYDEEISPHCKWKRRYGGLGTASMLWDGVHGIGACTYIVLVPTAILLNDFAEEKVAWISGSMFFLFTFVVYLTGEYLPVFSFLRCWILVWNPFLREPYFMLLLKEAVDDYVERSDERAASEGSNPLFLSTSLSGSPLSHPHGSGKGQGHGHTLTTTTAAYLQSPTSTTADNRTGIDIRVMTHIPSNIVVGEITIATPSPSEERERSDSEKRERLAEEADRALDNMVLRYMRRKPKEYLRVLGHFLVMTELVAMLTPSIAMGIQWVTALCDGPPVLVMTELLWELLQCAFLGECRGLSIDTPHCILKRTNGYIPSSI